MTDLREKANNILSSFSWTSKGDGDPLEIIESALLKAEREGWNAAIEKAIDAVKESVGYRSTDEHHTKIAIEEIRALKNGEKR